MQSCFKMLDLCINVMQDLDRISVCHHFMAVMIIMQDIGKLKKYRKTECVMLINLTIFHVLSD